MSEKKYMSSISRYDFRDGFEVRGEWIKEGFDLLVCIADYNYILINKKTNEIFSYCEHEICLTKCKNKKIFNKEIHKILNKLDKKLLEEAKHNFKI